MKPELRGRYDGRPTYYLNRTWRPRQWGETPVALRKEPAEAHFTIVTIKGRAWHEPGCHFWWVWTNKRTGDIMTLKCNGAPATETSRYSWERPARHGYCQWPHEHQLPALPDLNDNWSSMTVHLDATAGEVRRHGGIRQLRTTGCSRPGWQLVARKAMRSLWKSGWHPMRLRGGARQVHLVCFSLVGSGTTGARDVFNYYILYRYVRGDYGRLGIPKARKSPQ